MRRYRIKLEITAVGENGKALRWPKARSLKIETQTPVTADSVSERLGKWCEMGQRFAAADDTGDPLPGDRIVERDEST